MVYILLIITTSKDILAKENEKEALANTLNNPIANLTQIPFEYNTYKGIGPNNYGDKKVLNFKPVVPIELDENWFVVSRTIAGFVTEQKKIDSDYGNKHGLADTLQQTFLVAKKPTKNGYIWGVGPAILLPTSTEEDFSNDKYAIGPNVVVLKQSSGWTRGILGYHLFDLAGSGKEDVNFTFFEPFLAYSNKKGGTISINTEATYDWNKENLEVPINLLLKKVIPINSHLFQFMIGPRYYAVDYDGGPEGWSLRGGITWLLPR